MTAPAANKAQAAGHVQRTVSTFLELTAVFALLWAVVVLRDYGPFFQLALAGAFLVHMWSPSGRRRILPTLLAGALLLAFFTLLRGWPVRLLSLGNFLGFGSLAVLEWQALFGPQPDRGIAAKRFMVAAFPAVFVFFSTLFLAAASLAAPETYDSFLYAFDKLLLGRFASGLWLLVASSPLLHLLAAVVYLILPLMISLIAAVQMDRRDRPRADILVACAVAGGIAFLLQNFFPAVGPVYAFGAPLPERIPAAALTTLRMGPETARNAMPSLHVGWALLIWWHSRREAVWLKVVAALFLVLTVLATIGLGEHYWIDLVVAVPLALAVQAACLPPSSRRVREKRYALLLGSAMVVAWLVALRFAINSLLRLPVISWALVFCTLFASIFLALDLEKAPPPCPTPAVLASPPFAVVVRDVPTSDSRAAGAVLTDGAE